MAHNRIMRTTVNIPDHLLIEAKKLAATRKISLAALFEDSLRFYLAEQRAVKPSSEWVLPVFDGGPPVPGIDFNDTSALLEI